MNKLVLAMIAKHPNDIADLTRCTKIGEVVIGRFEDHGSGFRVNNNIRNNGSVISFWTQAEHVKLITINQFITNNRFTNFRTAYLLEWCYETLHNEIATKERTISECKMEIEAHKNILSLMKDM